MLVLDDGQKPQGWVDVNRLDTEVTPDALNRGGTVASVDGSLRGILDAALSSPTGRGVVADGQGRLLGTVVAGRVLERVDEAHPGVAEVTG